MATLPEPTVNVNERIQRTDITSSGQFTTDGSLKLVIQDADRAETYVLSKQWLATWPQATTLFQSPYTPQFWPGTQVERSSVSLFTVAKAVESLVPPIVNGIFSDDPPFESLPRPRTTADAARAVADIQSYQLKEINFRREIRYGVKNAILFGTGIWKWGWETFQKKRNVYKRGALPVVKKNPPFNDIEIHPPEEEEIIEETVTEDVDRPCFEHIVDVRHVLVDPGCNVPDIRAAKYVIHRNYLTFKQLDRLRNRPGYKIPSKEFLLNLFFPPVEQAEVASTEISPANPMWDLKADARYEDSTADPTEQPLEVLERWDNDKVIVVLNRKLVICNDENPYGRVPFLSVGWWDVPGAFYSLGLAKTIGSEQRLQQGVTNLFIDGMSLNLNGVYTRRLGKSQQSQNVRISPGKFINVDDPDDIKPLQRTAPVPEALQVLANSEARAADVSGDSEAVSRSLGAGRRTTGQADLITAGAANRPQDFVEKLADQVIVPFLYRVQEMNSALLPTKTLREILTNELQQAYTGDIVDILNAVVTFDISAASRMQARRNMAQAIPLLLQFLEQQPVQDALAMQGLKVEFSELIKMFMDVADLKDYYSLIVPMTPQQKQQFLAMQGGAQKIQAQTALNTQKFQQEQTLLDQKNVGRAANEVLRQAFQKAASPEALLGAPGGTGFGANA